jgi:hypothetical protein
VAKLYLKRYGHRILDNGYEVLGITPGTKNPTYNYSNEKLPKITHKHVDRLLSNGHARDGVGIRTRFTPLLDIDSKWERAIRAFTAYATKIIGQAPVRIGDAPIVGLMFRSTAPFKKVQSKEWTDPQGRKLQVEFLGDGQQFVAYAIHPGTKKPYRWTEDGQNPLRIAHDDLIEVTQEQAQKVCNYVDRWCFKRNLVRWKRTKTSTGTDLVPRRAGDVDDIAGDLDATPLPLSIDQVRSWLDRLPNDETVEYEESYNSKPDTANYRNVLFAIWHQTEGSEEGRDLAWAWSEQSSKHEEEEGRFDKLWNSADHESVEHPVTFRYIEKIVLRLEQNAKRELRDGFLDSILGCTDVDDLKDTCRLIAATQFEPLDFEQLAQAVKEAFKRITSKSLPIERARKEIMHRATETEIQEWVPPWVYVQHTKRFFNRETGQELEREAFDATFSRYLDGQQASFYALNIAKIKCYHLTMYKPDDDEEFLFDGNLCLNFFSERMMPPIPEKLNRRDRRAIALVERHIEHILPNERDRQLFISFLAYVVQTRSRPNWMIILQGVQGDGKSFFADLMQAVLGRRNIRRLDAQQLEDKYTAWAVGQMFCFVEELRLQGHSRFEIYNKIKPFISNSEINIHPKNVNPYQAINTTAYMAATNYGDALPVDDNDRRSFILKSKWQSGAAIRLFEVENPDYFKNLFGALERAGALRKWLSEYELSDEFDPKGRAPLTAAREEMIELSKSDFQIAFEDIISDDTHPRVGPELIVSRNLMAELGERTQEHVSGKGVAGLLTANNYMKLNERIRVDSDDPNKDSIWVKDQDFIHYSSAAELQRKVRQYIERRQRDLQPL